jgi:hypothetical protein
MVKVKVIIDLLRGRPSYEIEGTPEEIKALPKSMLAGLDQKITELVANMSQAQAKPVASAEAASGVDRADLMHAWIELVDNRPHLTSAVRNLTLKDQIMVALYAFQNVLRQDNTSPRALWEFLQEDGFPVAYGSFLARISELIRQAMLIRRENGIRLSRTAEEHVLNIMRGEGS